MKAGQEERLFRNHDPLVQEPFPDHGIVEDLGGGPCIGLAGVAAAGTAVETRAVGIVLRHAPVAAEEDQLGKAALGQAHVPERTGGKRHPGLGREDRDIDIAAAALLGMRVTRQVPDHPAEETEPECLDKDEARDGGVLEGLPGPGEPLVP